jgi:outer membrane protein assembly factor BamB
MTPLRRRVAGVIPILILLVPTVAQGWERSFPFIAAVAVDASGDVVIRDNSRVLLLDADQPRARVRWRYRAGRRAIISTVAPFRGGGVLIVGGLRPRSMIDGLFAARLSALRGKQSWRWTLDPLKAEQQFILSAVTTDAADDVLIAPLLVDESVNPGRYDSKFTVVKLDGATGEEHWRATVADLYHASSVATDADRNVVATAARDYDAAGSRVVVKMEAATGRVVWQTDLPPEWEEDVTSEDVTSIVGADGDVVVGFMVGDLGQASARAGVAKLSGVDGVLRWVALPMPGTPATPTRFFAIAERDGDVFAAGEALPAANSARPGARAFIVSRFDGTSGTLRWTYRSAEEGDFAGAGALGFDADNQVVAAGSIWNAVTCGDGFVVALDPASGIADWSQTIDGSFSTTNCEAYLCGGESCPPVDNDMVDGLAIDPRGPIIVLANVLNGSPRHLRDRYVIERVSPQR